MKYFQRVKGRVFKDNSLEYFLSLIILLRKVISGIYLKTEQSCYKW